YGEVYSAATFLVNGVSSSRATPSVKFKVDSIIPSTNLLVVSPSSGTTPLQIVVGLNPNAARMSGPGKYALSVRFTTVDQSPPRSDLAIVTVTLTNPEPPGIGGVVNSASLQPVISPG